MADIEPTRPRLWLRHETRTTECRAPLVPADARRLIEHGWDLAVEASPQRVFSDDDYAAVGCSISPAGSWVDTAADTLVLGLKELPRQPTALRHRHVYFGHAYKKQPGAARLLERFEEGGGALLDLEYLTADNGRRLAAFGYWAGYVGAALALLWCAGALRTPLRPGSKQALDAELRGIASATHPRVLVIGALGRSGQGALDAVRVAGATATGWDLAETARLDRAALLDHDVLVNTVLASGPIEPFVTTAQVERPAGRLSVVADVTCDIGAPFNALPIYDAPTSWDRPARQLRQDPPLAVIGIDNLPSLLPRESSTAFSADLTPQLLAFGTGAAPWNRCLQAYRDACRRAGITSGAPHA
ncbi:saccharopine dehydrogenase [Streptomyces sp. G44]|uniref:saccharopine dehydrogenase n=1 Tax=Streptomyces sp. G44 TaxID=2807632 RepID=UPI001961AC5F|nr:saccharopine dehydrogenase [Streptomyces sp. G44]MBM7168889.1 saccharopine dehydrogenase [Streptomyces sp. G44]